jgi:hypothetical protein
MTAHPYFGVHPSTAWLIATAGRGVGDNRRVGRTIALFEGGGQVETPPGLSVAEALTAFAKHRRSLVPALDRLKHPLHPLPMDALENYFRGAVIDPSEAYPEVPAALLEMFRSKRSPERPVQVVESVGGEIRQVDPDDQAVRSLVDRQDVSGRREVLIVVRRTFSWRHRAANALLCMAQFAAPCRILVVALGPHDEDPWFHGDFTHFHFRESTANALAYVCFLPIDERVVPVDLQKPVHRAFPCVKVGVGA